MGADNAGIERIQNWHFAVLHSCLFRRNLLPRLLVVGFSKNLAAMGGVDIDNIICTLASAASADLWSAMGGALSKSGFPFFDTDFRDHFIPHPN